MEVKEDTSSLLMRAYKDGKWSDVTIMNGDKKYQVHKHILSTAIPYFDKKFTSGLKESSSQVINLDHPPNAFDLIIEWAYGSKIKITKENAVDLFHLADYMNIPKLTTVCLNFLWNNFSDSPFIDVGHWINQIATEEVNNVIDRYICSNFLDIVNTDSFLDYDVDTVAHMLSLHDLDIDDEIQVFDAIIRWIQKSVERQSHLPKLLKKITWADINGVQFMNRIDKLPWIEKCDEVRPVIMAAFELSYFKSLKQIQVNDVNFKRISLNRFHYAIYRKTDASIIAHNFNGNYGKIIFSENRSLPTANFGDSHISEHNIDSDVVIRIDWKNKTYRLFKSSDFYCYTLLFERLFQITRYGGKVDFWKGKRLIEFGRLSGDNTLGQSTFTATKHKGGICLSSINTVQSICIPSADTTSASSIQNRNQNQIRQYKSKLTIEKCTPPANYFVVVASHEIVTKEPIKKLKSTTFHDLLLIFVDCSLILSYDFQKNIFKEHNKLLNGRSLCFLHFRYNGPKLLIFNIDGSISREGFSINNGELSHWSDSRSSYSKIVPNSQLIGFISLEKEHNAKMHDC
ncbi:kelch-like protein 26 [Tetranychus urticae]|uniref:BTB domain-containing protein n=1 Tax=Tetranychus urticae TaxID=32264 RepID=T1KW85_TETUR|nr:kelch-like protein 26 [Tetranychus urticae]